MADRINNAIKAFANGLPVCVFDSEFREGETDLSVSYTHLRAHET